ncbi:MAG TPA: beta-N-acetylhexosaminidase, partial [Vicinamibacterales bacterium]|nr:beta-N-acetylhexosaminidase [Vicinamibacterales bacterium]
MPVDNVKAVAPAAAASLQGCVMPSITPSTGATAPARLRALAVLALAVIVAGAGLQPMGSPLAQAGSPAPVERPALIPWPASVSLAPGEAFSITKDTVIEVTPAHPELRRIADVLADLVWPALEARLAVRDAAPAPVAGTIRLEVEPGSARPDEGYNLSVAADGVRIAARTPAGVFYGVQTLRQLLPWSIELRGVRPFAVSVPAARITDAPRFGWRGAMLDVARHFFSPAEVKRYIDLLALYKINRLHLHLTDDQGWRIEITKWPKLTTIGGSTEVKGGPGGFYTQTEYADIVAYARDRFMTIVPEIDMPSHCNAALASYPELNCDGKAPPLYTGIEVGFSNFCFDKPITYTFLDDVLREVAAMTPGPWLHVGGDEVKKMTPAQYAAFMERAQGLVIKHGKIPVGWDEIIHSKLQPSTVVQYWRPDASLAPPPGTKLILSPASRVYLDMKYDADTPVGGDWAGHIDL